MVKVSLTAQKTTSLTMAHLQGLLGLVIYGEGKFESPKDYQFDNGARGEKNENADASAK